MPLETIDELFRDIDLSDVDKFTLTEYIHFIRHSRFFKRTGTIRPGLFYTYFYFFDKTNTPYEKLKFYDRFPLILCLNVEGNGKYFTGVNFHHLPVFARKFLLNKIIRHSPESKFMRNGYNVLFDIDYDELIRFLKKSKIAVRRYRKDRVRENRMVSNILMPELIKFDGRTYFRVTIQEIEKRYRAFRYR